MTNKQTIINKREIALAVAKVKNLDGFAVYQLVGKAKVSHIGSAGGPVNGKKAQAR